MVQDRKPADGDGQKHQCGDEAPHCAAFHLVLGKVLCRLGGHGWEEKSPELDRC
jgi:hypothetical protein